MLKNLRLYLRAQSQGHHTIDRLEEGNMERGSTRQSSSKGRERAVVNQTNIEGIVKQTNIEGIVNQTNTEGIVKQTNIGTVSKPTLGNLLTDEVERTWAFPRAKIPY